MRHNRNQTLKGKRILVTGGSGFIGTHLCRFLASQGCQVRVLDISTPVHGVSNVEYQEGNVCNAQDVTFAMRGVEAVFHLAALVSVPLCDKYPVESYRTNVLGTSLVLEKIREQSLQLKKPIRLVFSSSSAVYGDRGLNCEPMIEKEATLWPCSLYAAQKLASEQAIRIFYAQHKVPSVVFRFFNVFGPGQNPNSPYSGVLSIFSNRIVNSLPLEVDGGGVQTRDFVFVTDIAKACVSSLLLPDSQCNAEAINLGTGSSISIRNLALTMMRITKSNLPLKETPPRLGDVLHSCANIERARNLMNWIPTTSLKAGLTFLANNSQAIAA